MVPPGCGLGHDRQERPGTKEGEVGFLVRGAAWNWTAQLKGWAWLV